VQKQTMSCGTEE